MSSNYYELLEKALFGSLLFVFLMLFITVFLDIFVYRPYEIQYNGIFLKTAYFAFVLFILLSADKTAIIQLIPHNLGI